MHLTTTLFDMDGLLLDSEILWHKAEVEILGELDVPIVTRGTRSTKGMFVSEVIAYWYGISPWSGPSCAEVEHQILERVGELVETKGRLMPGALRAIDLTSSRGRVALASSTPRSLIERCLHHFSLLDRFEVIATAADEKFGKPHPAVFLTAAEKLNVPPTACLVFEDSGAGVLAAKAARMACVAVPVTAERTMPEFSLADLVLSSLEALEESWLDERFARS